MEYQLELKEERQGNVIKYKYYKVLNYDNNEDNLKEFVKKLNEDSVFNIDYYIHSINDSEVIIEEVIDTLD